MAINLVKSQKSTIEDWELLIDSNQGIYIPQSFARQYGHYLPATKQNLENLAILKKGPDQEFYCEAWEEVLDQTITNEAGKQHTLYHNCDLWAVPADFDWDTYDGD